MTSIGKRGWGLSLVVIALLATGFGIGHFSNDDPVAAQQAKNGVVPASANAPANVNQRVIAYVFGSTAITREEFGDYLISLYGKERLELYINKRIIEMHCAAKKVEISPAEIDASIAEDCKRIGVPESDFVKRVLKERYNKTLEEWRNDVMRPRLLLAKLIRENIQVEEEDLKKMFENRYGAKARVKIILWPLSQRAEAERRYGDLRKEGPKDNPDLHWDSVATKQPDPTIGAKAGEIEPIGRHSGPESAKIEAIAFNLKVGEVSPIIELPIGLMVVKRIGTIEPVPGVNFDKVKAELRKEVVERKLEREIPKAFAKIKEEAKPILLDLVPTTTGMR